MSEGDGYGGLEVAARAEEEIVAADGDVEAKVTVETRAPSTEPAAVLCEALAAANKSVVDRVFSENPEEAPERSDDPIQGAQIETNDGEAEDSQRIMDWGGPDE
jgi:hypothetical protein